MVNYKKLSKLLIWKCRQKKLANQLPIATMAANEEVAEEPLLLLPCASCTRTFRPEALAKHSKVCEKTLMKKRKTFDSAKQRLQGTEIENFATQPAVKSVRKKDPQHAPSKARQKEKIDVAKSIQVAKKAVESVSTVQVKPSDHEECPYCGRTFGPKAFERHTEFCKEQHQKLKLTPSANNEAKERLKVRTSYRGPLTNKVLNRDRYQPARNRDPSPSMGTSLTELREEEVKGKGLMRNGSLRSSLRSRPRDVTPPPLRRTMTQINPPRNTRGSRDGLNESLERSPQSSNTNRSTPRLYSRESTERKMKSSECRSNMSSPRKKVWKSPLDLNDTSVNTLKGLTVTTATIEKMPPKQTNKVTNQNTRSKLPHYQGKCVNNPPLLTNDNRRLHPQSRQSTYENLSRGEKDAGSKYASQFHYKNLESWKNLKPTNKGLHQSNVKRESVLNSSNAKSKLDKSEIHRFSTYLHSNDSESSVISLSQSEGQTYDGATILNDDLLNFTNTKCPENKEKTIEESHNNNENINVKLKPILADDSVLSSNKENPIEESHNNDENINLNLEPTLADNSVLSSNKEKPIEESHNNYENINVNLKPILADDSVLISNKEKPIEESHNNGENINVNLEPTLADDRVLSSNKEKPIEESHNNDENINVNLEPTLAGDSNSILSSALVSIEDMNAANEAGDCTHNYLSYSTGKSNLCPNVVYTSVEEDIRNSIGTGIANVLPGKNVFIFHSTENTILPNKCTIMSAESNTEPSVESVSFDNEICEVQTSCTKAKQKILNNSIKLFHEPPQNAVIDEEEIKVKETDSHLKNNPNKESNCDTLLESIYSNDILLVTNEEFQTCVDSSSNCDIITKEHCNIESYMAESLDNSSSPEAHPLLPETKDPGMLSECSQRSVNDSLLERNVPDIPSVNEDSAKVHFPCLAERILLLSPDLTLDEAQRPTDASKSTNDIPEVSTIDQDESLLCGIENNEADFNIEESVRNDSTEAAPIFPTQIDIIESSPGYEDNFQKPHDTQANLSKLSNFEILSTLQTVPGTGNICQGINDPAHHLSELKNHSAILNSDRNCSCPNKIISCSSVEYPLQLIGSDLNSEITQDTTSIVNDLDEAGQLSQIVKISEQTVESCDTENKFIDTKLMFIAQEESTSQKIKEPSSFNITIDPKEENKTLKENDSPEENTFFNVDCNRECELHTFKCPDHKNLKHQNCPACLTDVNSVGETVLLYSQFNNTLNLREESNDKLCKNFIGKELKSVCNPTNSNFTSNECYDLSLKDDYTQLEDSGELSIDSLECIPQTDVSSKEDIYLNVGLTTEHEKEPTYAVVCDTSAMHEHTVEAISENIFNTDLGMIQQEPEISSLQFESNKDNLIQINENRFCEEKGYTKFDNLQASPVDNNFESSILINRNAEDEQFSLIDSDNKEFLNSRRLHIIEQIYDLLDTEESPDNASILHDNDNNFTDSTNPLKATDIFPINANILDQNVNNVNTKKLCYATDSFEKYTNVDQNCTPIVVQDMHSQQSFNDNLNISIEGFGSANLNCSNLVPTSDKKTTVNHQCTDIYTEHLSLKSDVYNLHDEENRTLNNISQDEVYVQDKNYTECGDQLQHNDVLSLLKNDIESEVSIVNSFMHEGKIDNGRPYLSELGIIKDLDHNNEANKGQSIVSDSIIHTFISEQENKYNPSISLNSPLFTANKTLEEMDPILYPLLDFVTQTFGDNSITSKHEDMSDIYCPYGQNSLCAQHSLNCLDLISINQKTSIFNCNLFKINKETSELYQYFKPSLCFKHPTDFSPNQCFYVNKCNRTLIRPKSAPASCDQIIISNKENDDISGRHDIKDYEANFKKQEVNVHESSDPLSISSVLEKNDNNKEKYMSVYNDKDNIDSYLCSNTNDECQCDHPVDVFGLLETITEDSLEGNSRPSDQISSNRSVASSEVSRPRSSKILFWNDHQQYVNTQDESNSQFNYSNSLRKCKECIDIFRDDSTDEGFHTNFKSSKDIERDSLDGSCNSESGSFHCCHSVKLPYLKSPLKENCKMHDAKISSGSQTGRHRLFKTNYHHSTPQDSRLPPVIVYKKITKHVETFYENAPNKHHSHLDANDYFEKRITKNKVVKIPPSSKKLIKESSSSSDWDTDSSSENMDPSSEMLYEESYESIEHNKNSDDYQTVKTSIYKLPCTYGYEEPSVKLPPLMSSIVPNKPSLEKRKKFKDEKLPPLKSPNSDAEKYNPYLSAERQMQELFGGDESKPKATPLPEIPRSSPIQSSPTSAFVKYSSPKRSSSVENLKSDNKENNNDSPVVIGTSLQTKTDNHKNFSLSNLSLCSVVSIDSLDCNKNSVNPRLVNSHLDSLQRSFSAVESKTSRSHGKTKVNLQEMLYGSHSPDHATRSESSNSDAGNLEACEAELLISMLEFEKMLKSSPIPSPQSSPPISEPPQRFSESVSLDAEHQKNQKNLNNTIDSAYSSLTRSIGGEGDKKIGKPLTDAPKFCHECGSMYPVAVAKFCCNCGVRRIVL